MPKKWPFVSAFFAQVMVELVISVIYSSEPMTTLSRLSYTSITMLVIYLALVGLRPLLRRQVLVVASIQAAFGVALIVLGATLGVTTYPVAEPISTGLAVAGPAIALTSMYLILVDLRQIDIRMVPGPQRRGAPAHHHNRTIAGGHQAYGRTYEGIAYDTDLFRDCFAILNPQGVHFVASFKGEVCQFYVDAIGTASLGGVIGASADERRARLERAGRQLVAMHSRITPGVANIEHGTLVRATLDVQDGGIFLYRLSRGQYLVGATLHQPLILLAQHKLDGLARRHQRFPYGEPGLPLMRVRDLVCDYPSLPMTAAASDAAVLIAQCQVSSVVVLDNSGMPMAMLSGGDLLRAALPAMVVEEPAIARLFDTPYAELIAAGLNGRTVAQCLPSDADKPLRVSPQVSVLELAAIMQRERSGIVVVTDDARYLGAVSVSALFDAATQG